ncbi:MAG: hypothetical protein JW751_12490, partial [Polyangiaceae bacterium]|nr:hypothetical protein [Polyangiaceae bacterium]
MGAVRAVTVTLTSSQARPIIEVVPIPALTNEMGIFPAALAAFCDAYGGLELATLVTYDAGACSAQNAAEVRARGLHYLFGLKRHAGGRAPPPPCLPAPHAVSQRHPALERAPGRALEDAARG